jgi:hypothetical protein
MIAKTITKDWIIADHLAEIHKAVQDGPDITGTELLNSIDPSTVTDEIIIQLALCRLVNEVHRAMPASPDTLTHLEQHDG